MASSNNINKLELQDLQLAENLQKITLHKLIAEKVEISKMVEKSHVQSAYTAVLQCSTS